RVVADVEEDGAEDLRGGAGPVLERLADELAEGDDEAALVPDADDDVGAGDLLDASPLVVDDDDVVQADRLRHRDLDAGDEVLEHGAGGEADGEAGEPGGGEQRGADLADGVERHEDRGGGHDHDEDDDRLAQDLELRVEPAGLEVVGDVDAV